MTTESIEAATTSKPVAWASATTLDRLKDTSKGAINCQLANTNFLQFEVALYAAPASPQVAKADIALIREALRFYVWAAGQGLTPADGEPALDPQECLSMFSIASGDEDFDGYPDRIVSRLTSYAPALAAPASSASQADPDEAMCAYPECGCDHDAVCNAALPKMAPSVARADNILDHKWLDPECGANGCQSLIWKRRYEAAEERIAKLKEELAELQRQDAKS